MSRSDVLISADELLTRMAGTPAPRLLDVRWTLPKPDGREDFAAGHIPGALYVDLDTELADSVTLVEWGGGIAETLATDGHLVVEIDRDSAEDESRLVRLTGHGSRWAGQLDGTAS